MNMRGLHHVVIIAAAVGILTVSSIKTFSNDPETHNAISGNLRELKALDALINHDILRTRFHHLNNYDPLVTNIVQVRRRLDLLRNDQSGLYGQGLPGIDARIDQYAQLESRRERLLERFKSTNAILRNSALYFPTLASEAEGQLRQIKGGEVWASQISDLLKKILLLNLRSDNDLIKRAEALIDKIVVASTWSSVPKAQIHLFLEHARNIIAQKKLTDRLVNDLLALPLLQLNSEIFNTYNQNYLRVESEAATYRIILYLTSLALVIYVLYLLVNLRSASKVLEKRVVERTNEIDHLAAHDALTGLANRRLCMENLCSALEQAEQSGGSAVVFHLDLDGFKSVNDTLGHQAGDEVLCEVAKRLLGVVAETDTVARVGGDEFVIIFPGRGLDWDPEPVAKEILEAFDSPFRVINDMRVDVGCTIGISRYPVDDREAESLLVAADLALYRAKEMGKNRFLLFDVAMRSEFQGKIELARQVRRAIAEGEFEAFYQPQIEIGTGRVVGVEALARWRDPEHGLRSPSDFLDVLDHSGGMQKLGVFMMERAIADAASWHRAGISFGRIGLNISTSQLGDPEFIDSLLNNLFANGLPPQLLAIEILEGAVISSHNRRLRALLDELNDLQISVEFDDFGTGYASLNHLHQLPVNRVKIDRSFVTDIVENPNHRNIVSGVIDIVRKLGLGVIAEGVESVEQAMLLKKWGCPYVQGYLFAPPLPLAETTTYLKLADHKRSLDAIAQAEHKKTPRLQLLSSAS